MRRSAGKLGKGIMWPMNERMKLVAPYMKSRSGVDIASGRGRKRTLVEDWVEVKFGW